MIRLQRITTRDAGLYAYMERLMTVSFPAEEYRPLDELRKITDGRPEFYNNVILQDDVPVGLMTYWDFGDFCYAEHFAIDPERRNGGYGQRALKCLCDMTGPIVLEVEMPEEEMAIRRVNFYKRQGFVLWEKDYLQPPYRPGDGFLPMRLMAYGNLDCSRDFVAVRNRIYREAYKVSEEDLKAMDSQIHEA